MTNFLVRPANTLARMFTASGQADDR